MVEINNQEYTLFKAYLLDSCGIDIPVEKRYLFNTRLGELLNGQNCNSFSELYRILQSGREMELRNQIVEMMTTNETAFFRDGHPFTALENVILPEICAGRRKAALPPRLRIWSAACSTGQEPYSIAMVLRNSQVISNVFSPGRIDLIATDISTRAIEHARRGIYSNAEVENGIKSEYREKYLVKEETGWQIKKEISAMIEFRLMNLSKPFPPGMGKLDIIFCRNVIIYFSAKVKEQIIRQFYHLLKPGGILIIGAAENLYSINNGFESVHLGPTTLYKVKENG